MLETYIGMPITQNIRKLWSKYCGKFILFTQDQCYACGAVRRYIKNNKENIVVEEVEWQKQPEMARDITLTVLQFSLLLTNRLVNW